MRVEEKIIRVHHPKSMQNLLAMCVLLVALAPGYIQGYSPRHAFSFYF
jgi:hypothetical protein